MEEINKLTFIESGKYDIGYEINKKQRWILRFQRNVIGQFEITYNKKCQYLVKAHTPCFGFFIRKVRWRYLADQYPIFFRYIDMQGYVNYIHKIWKKIRYAKQ